MEALKKYSVNELMAAITQREKQRERDRRKYLRTQEERKEYAKVYYQEHKEHILARQRARMAAAAPAAVVPAAVVPAAAETPQG
jgi:hypothetical protein